MLGQGTPYSYSIWGGEDASNLSRTQSRWRRGNMVPMTDYLGVNIGFKLKLTMLSKRRKERQANKKSSGLFFVTNCNAKAREEED